MRVPVTVHREAGGGYSACDSQGSPGREAAISDSAVTLAAAIIAAGSAGSPVTKR